MAAIIEKIDLPVETQAAEMIDAMVAGANAKASRVAPCLTWDGTVDDQPAPSADTLAEAKLVLLGAVRRWVEAGSGAYQQQTAGVFSVSTDTRQRSGYNLWPSEIEALQDICSAGKDGSSKAFSITPGGSTVTHMPWCSINFGATYCSCGADIGGGVPLYEGGILTGDEY